MPQTEVTEIRNVTKLLLRGLLATAALSLILLGPGSEPVQAACAKSVVLFNAYWCPYCREVRSLLGRYRIDYQLVEVTAEPGRSLSLSKFGDISVPRTVIGSVVVEGYDPDRIKQLLCLDDDGPQQPLRTPVSLR